MSLPRVVAVAPGSPAERAGLVPGDEVLALDGEVPRDVIRWQVLVDEAEVELEVRRCGLDRALVVRKAAGEPLGAEVSSSIFDAVQTCDNACEFCFIHHLPKRLLRNRRGATSLRGLRALLDAGIEVHGQVVVCPGVNDGEVLEDTLVGVLDRYPGLATLCVVPLGVSRYAPEGSLRAH